MQTKSAELPARPVKPVSIFCVSRRVRHGYTCGDLFLEPVLLKGAEDACAAS